MDSNIETAKRFGTAPVFFTAISTILGAILFLRFGFAMGTVGFWGVALIIVLGHLVTIPTALAISEIATNKRVEGGGEYFIISRSFGLNIGGTIGIALFFSQAISVAFYVIAFTEAFEFFFNWMAESMNIVLPRQVISIPVMIILSIIILRKGANLGVKALYVVVAILVISLIMFFLGSPTNASPEGYGLKVAEFRNMKDFFMVFAIIFPAFTGMTAGVGLSGDLKNPAKSIPRGTVTATITGMIVYFFIIFKLGSSASVQEMLDNQLIMGKIAILGFLVIPLGLAASTISSALGSVMVAPRTLQALASDSTFPSKRINQFLSAGKGDANEPYNATLITCIIAMFFVALGSINAVAEIISMFFMVTYGSLCLISFLNHFGSSPSYRPSFRSKWYISLTGFIVAVWVMFKINTLYAALAVIFILLLYIYINNFHKTRQGLSGIVINSLFQLNRNLQVYLQKKKSGNKEMEWRPSVVCISKSGFDRNSGFDVLNWISFKYGFGTYIHKIPGYYSHQAHLEAMEELERLREKFDRQINHVYIDTLISPSFTSAVAQTIQIPGISGMENNMVLFDFARDDDEELDAIIDNLPLVNAGEFDIGIISASNEPVKFKNGIHIWLRPFDIENANLMILLSFIILGHPDWKKSDIRIFQIYKKDEIAKKREQIRNLIQTGRLPITEKNLEWIEESQSVRFRDLVNEKSEKAGLVLIGFHRARVKHEGAAVFKGYTVKSNILFINSHTQIEIS
jgi:amino acid transporter